MTRDELIEAGARAFYEAAYGPDSSSQDMRRRLAPHMRAVLDVVEPLIRADEREQNRAEYVPVLLEHLRQWADLRAKVEALGSPLSDEARESRWLLRADVLALFDGDTP